MLMSGNIYDEYIKKYDSVHPLLNSDIKKSVEILDIDNISEDWQKRIADTLLGTEHNKDTAVAGVFISYGYRLCAAVLKGHNEFLTHQTGYKDSSVFSYNVDDKLNLEENTEDINPEYEEYNGTENNSEKDIKSAGNLLSWIINPESNIDVFDDIIYMMVIPAVKKCLSALPPKRKTVINIMMPPVSEELQFDDWDNFFSSINISDMTVNILSYDMLTDVSDAERRYFILEQGFEEKKYLIITAYEMNRGHIANLGTLAFDVSSGNTYNLYSIYGKNIFCGGSNEQYKKTEENDNKNVFSPVESKLPYSAAFPSFLGTNSVSFLFEEYTLAENAVSETKEVQDIIDVFAGCEALQIADVCSRILKESNLYNISLSDMVSIANIMQRNSNIFKPSMLKTFRSGKLGSYNLKDIDKDAKKIIKSIPSNYASIIWKRKNRFSELMPLKDVYKDKFINKEKVEAIIDCFNPCTTEDIAMEILYIFKHDVEADPSAYFAAKIFIMLSNYDNIVIDSRNENISS